MISRWSVRLWGLLALAVAVKSIAQPMRRSVYPIFVEGARSWWADESLYAAKEGLDVYRYSPTFAVLFTPFQALPDRIGALLWGVLSVVVLYLAVRALVRRVLPGEWPLKREEAFLCLAIVGSIRSAWAAQTNAAVTACAIGAAVAVVRRRWWIAALLLGVAVSIKLWPLALFLLLGALWPKQLIPRFLAIAAALALVPFLTRPPGVVLDQYAAWFESLTQVQAGQRWPGFRDLWTILEQLGPVNQTVYRVLQLGAAFALFAWCLWQRRRSERDERLLLTLVLSGWVAWQLFLGPGTERMTYALAAPFVSWAVIASMAGKRHRALAWTAFALAFVLGTGAVERALKPLISWSPALQPLGALVFAVWLVRWVTAGAGAPHNAAAGPHGSHAGRA